MEENKDLTQVTLRSIVHIEKVKGDYTTRLEVPAGMSYDDAYECAIVCAEALKEMQRKSKEAAEAAKKEDIEPEIVDNKEKNGRKK